MKVNYDLPKKEQIQDLYESYRPIFTQILNNVEKKLKDVIKINSAPIYKARIKSFNSYYKKILRQKPKEAGENSELVTLTDMIGIRVICAFLEDLGIVEQQLVNAFDVKEIEKKGAEQSFREFGYESVHVLVAIPEDCVPENAPELPDNLVCEIQIRTILQDAWAEVEHELIYKSEFNPFDKPLRRKLASINASLSLADTIFQEIRDYQNKLQSELGCRRNTFYDKADEFSDRNLGLVQGQSHSSETVPESAEKITVFAKGSIDDLVLQALHEHNLGNFDRAIRIYTQILSVKPEPGNVVLSVIHKHRGMAYFAQNKYDEALDDFIISEEKDPKAFRSVYYQGIVYSVKNNDEAAIECFNRSLEVDSYQSHVYYRRALAYFNLGEYNLAMKDVNSSMDLGYKNEDVMALKEKLIKKFDMNM